MGRVQQVTHSVPFWGSTRTTRIPCRRYLQPAQVTTHIKITEIPGKWIEINQRSISSDHSADINIFHWFLCLVNCKYINIFIYIYICSKICRSYLVGGIPTPLKNMSSSMGRMTTHMLWKIKFMFQTTNLIPSGYLT